MVDIKLDDNLRLTQAANGDAPVIVDIECLLQDIKLEAVTQEGDLFYAPDYGWSLLDFMQCEDTDLNRLEISERIRKGLSSYEKVDTAMVQVDVDLKENMLQIHIRFALLGNDNAYELELVLDRIKVVVT